MMVNEPFIRKKRRSFDLGGFDIFCESDYFDGQLMDTKIKIDGSFWTTGIGIEPFVKEFQALIEKYRI